MNTSLENENADQTAEAGRSREPQDDRIPTPTGNQDSHRETTRTISFPDGIASMRFESGSLEGIVAVRLLDLLSDWRRDDTRSWWKVAGTLRNCGVPYEEFREWSLTTSHRDAMQVERAWDNVKSSASLGTLIYYARMDAGEEQVRSAMSGHWTGPARQWDSPVPPKMAGAAQSKTRSAHDPMSQAEDVGRRFFTVVNELHEGMGEQELIDASPCRLDDNPVRHGDLILSTLYAPHEQLFIGDRYGKEVRPVSKWLEIISSSDARTLPHIIPNPLSGAEMPTKNGDRLTRRGDGCVSSFRFAVVEMDDRPKNEQARFWLHMIKGGVPVSAVIDSGGKSLHAWLRVDVDDASEWESKIEKHLFKTLLEPLGVDPACKNEARLSRFPGQFRWDRQAWQRLVYLDPQAGRIAS